MNAFTTRSPVDDDVPALTALFNACDVADLGRPDSDEEDVVWLWRMPGFDRGRDASVVLDRGEVVGYSVVFDSQADVYVHPTRRGLGLGTRLLNNVEERALEQGGVVLRQNISDRATAARELLERAGYEKSHHYTRLEKSLSTEPAAAPEPVHGVSIRTFEVSDARRLYDAHRHAWRGYEGLEWQPDPYDVWATEMQGDDFDPELWLIVEDAGEVVGFLMGFERACELGWVQRIGTIPEHRGRGIGRALMGEIERIFRARGMTRLGLTVSSRNVSSARRLYERAGMTEVLRIDNYRKTLRPRAT